MTGGDDELAKCLTDVASRLCLATVRDSSVNRLHPCSDAVALEDAWIGLSTLQRKAKNESECRQIACFFARIALLRSMPLDDAESVSFLRDCWILLNPISEGVPTALVVAETLREALRKSKASPFDLLRLLEADLAAEISNRTPLQGDVPETYFWGESNRLFDEAEAHPLARLRRLVAFERRKLFLDVDLLYDDPHFTVLEESFRLANPDAFSWPEPEKTVDVPSAFLHWHREAVDYAVVVLMEGKLKETARTRDPQKGKSEVDACPTWIVDAVYEIYDRDVWEHIASHAHLLSASAIE